MLFYIMLIKKNPINRPIKETQKKRRKNSVKTVK